ncbi:MAG: hypothetical protein NVS4B3_24190 [Gemmatimonadaceae bacterium]
MRVFPCILSTLPLALYASATYAQQASPAPAQFVVLHYMKAAPGKADEYVRLEQEVWKPIHQERVKNKDMVAWQLYTVPYTADTHRDYDYVTANLYDNLAATEGTGLLDVFRRMHAGKEGSNLETQTLAARQIVRSEVWQMLAHTTPRSTAGSSSAPSKYVVMDFMRSKPGVNYVAVETELWKPIHQERVKSGGLNSWALAVLLLPGGTSYGYDFVTANAMSSLSGLSDQFPAELFQRVHPNTSVADISNRTAASRDLTRHELWVLVDATR